jgi:hypothetical protein
VLVLHGLLRHRVHLLGKGRYLQEMMDHHLAGHPYRRTDAQLPANTYYLVPTDKYTVCVCVCVCVAGCVQAHCNRANFIGLHHLQIEDLLWSVDRFPINPTSGNMVR